MNIVVFGLTLSSSWGNGHATLWRGLAKALIRRGHAFTFFEHDTPYYRQNRDLHALPGGTLLFYADWPAIAAEARRSVAQADVAIVTSYCPHAREAERLVLDGGATRVFYDLDTPVTLSRLGEGSRPDYVGPDGFSGYDLVLSYTGGRALTDLRDRLGARRVAPLYGHVDPSAHRPADPTSRFSADLSYLGTYAPDRQDALERLFVEPARRLPRRKFLIGGAQYPDDFPWTSNIFFVRHLPPAEHPAFFSSGRLTLNVTRAAMAAMGWCPSGRLFEAAACGSAILTDRWAGLEAFFDPGSELIAARTPDDVAAALDLTDGELRRIGDAARARALAEHTSDRRARDFERAVEQARMASPQGVAGAAAGG